MTETYPASQISDVRWYITKVCAFGNGQLIYAAQDQDEQYEYNLLWHYNPARIQQGQNPWHLSNFDGHIAAITPFCAADGQVQLAVLSDSGELWLGDGEHWPHQEKIPGTQSYKNTDGETWGDLCALRQIGRHLYACGYHGQVYRRGADNSWQAIDEGLRQSPKTSVKDCLHPQVIDGLHENAIYAAGFQHNSGLAAQAAFYNGQYWREVALPERNNCIHDIWIENEQRVWLCGDDRTLLLGNVEQGFHQPCLNEERNGTMGDFTSLCPYQNKIWLAARLDEAELFVYDPAQPQLDPQPVYLDFGAPPHSDFSFAPHSLKVDGQYLWALSDDAIARFDGKSWQRIALPESPCIAVLVESN